MNSYLIQINLVNLSSIKLVKIVPPKRPFLSRGNKLILCNKSMKGFKLARGPALVELEILGLNNIDRDVDDKNFAKYRTSYARVLAITDVDSNSLDSAASIYDGSFVYEVGKIARVSCYTSLKNQVCGGGIHFFLTKEAALSYRELCVKWPLDKLSNPVINYGNSGRVFCTMWHLNEKFHREDGPAVIHADGSERWYFKGKLHRVGGPACIRADGTRSWYFNDNLHRTDGPAMIIADGSKHWYENGERHRSDGPAIIKAGGWVAWYKNGVCVEETKN